MGFCKGAYRGLVVRMSLMKIWPEQIPREDNRWEDEFSNLLEHQPANPTFSGWCKQMDQNTTMESLILAQDER